MKKPMFPVNGNGNQAMKPLETPLGERGTLTVTKMRENNRVRSAVSPSSHLHHPLSESSVAVVIRKRQTGTQWPTAPET